MPLKFRLSRWWIAVVLAITVLLAWVAYRAGPDEPVYQGRRLGSWLRGHPKEYYPAVLAVGTNALPYLLAELQAKDSPPTRFAERMLAKMNIGPFWRRAGDRYYHAGLGLQILDTNAVPALLDLIFSKPMQFVYGNPSYSAVCALDFMTSVAARSQVCESLGQGLNSADAQRRRNACMTLSIWPCEMDNFKETLTKLSRDPDPSVRAAAVRVFMTSVSGDDLILQTMIPRLKDEQAIIRGHAIEALMPVHKSNAVVVLPALRAAYSNELAQSNLRGDLGDGFSGAQVLSPRDIRKLILIAMKAIDPDTPLPSDPP